jgi:enediyne biosynthesis protein E5
LSWKNKAFSLYKSPFYCSISARDILVLLKKMIKTLTADARHFQIAFLSSLLLLGLTRLDFQIVPAQIAVIFAAGLATQAFFLRRLKLDAGYKSALVTCLGLSLLLRSDRLWVPAAVSAAAAASKFLLRANGKHLFNPANFGVVFGLLVTGHAWVSPAQWGHDAVLAAWFVMLGATVVFRANRSDVSWAFLACYLGLCLLRVLYLGQRTAVWEHQLENGSLLLFTFFMISDPKTIPDSRRGRFLLAFLVAAAAFVRQYGFYRINGLFYALFFITPTTALWDRLWSQGGRYEWLPSRPARAGAFIA